MDLTERLNEITRAHEAQLATVTAERDRLAKACDDDWAKAETRNLLNTVARLTAERDTAYARGMEEIGRRLAGVLSGLPRRQDGLFCNKTAREIEAIRAAIQGKEKKKNETHR